MMEGRNHQFRLRSGWKLLCGGAKKAAVVAVAAAEAVAEAVMEENEECESGHSHSPSVRQNGATGPPTSSNP